MDEQTVKKCPFCGKSHPVYVVQNDNGERLFDAVSMQYHDTPTCEGIPVDVWQSRPIEDALKARIAELEEKCSWISVWERLPENGTWVEIKDVNGNVNAWLHEDYMTAELKTHWAYWRPYR